jgi:hypothetical protein
LLLPRLKPYYNCSKFTFIVKSCGCF